MLLLKTQNHKIIKIRDYTVEVISTLSHRESPSGDSLNCL